MKKMHGKPVTLGLLSVLMVIVSFGSAAARADVVLDWNVIAVNTAVANKQNPFAQARYAAIVQLAVFEAVNSITHQYQPYLGTITAPPRRLPRRSSDRGCISGAQHLLSSQPAERFTPIGCQLDGSPYQTAQPKPTASPRATPQLRR